MLKVYNMSSGNLELQSDKEEYDDEVLYSGYQPQIQDFVELRLQQVTSVTDHGQNAQSSSISDELATIDCESFISSHEKK